MHVLVEELKQCESDTLTKLNPGAAERLANWQRYEDNIPELINFVQRVIHGPKRRNGLLLYQAGGRSLEQIVIDYGPPTFLNGHRLFKEEDVWIAKETLGLL